MDKSAVDEIFDMFNKACSVFVSKLIFIANEITNFA